MRTPSWRPSRTLLSLTAPLAFALVFSCAARPLKTADSAPTATSGGAPVDPISSVPRPVDRATVNDGVATLRTPIATEAIHALVRRVFEGFHRRDPGPLEPDLDESIVDLRADNEQIRPRGYWMNELRVRMKSLPFDQLDLDLAYKQQDVEIWGREELGVPGRPSRPNTMTNDDVLVRIPIATPRVGSDVLFGDEIRLLLRRDGPRYKIRGWGEAVPK